MNSSRHAHSVRMLVTSEGYLFAGAKWHLLDVNPTLINTLTKVEVFHASATLIVTHQVETHHQSR